MTTSTRSVARALTDALAARVRTGARGAVRAVPVALAALCLLSPAAHAQVVHGRVVDATTARPVHHAALELVSDRDQVLARTTTDSLGTFRIRGWQPGKYRLRTQALGYATVSSELLELATGDVLELRIRLAADAIPLEPIVIRQRARTSLAEIALAGYYDRRDAGQRLGNGRFLDRGAIATRGKRLSDVLATVPGVRVVQVSGCPVPIISMAGNNALESRAADQLVRMGGTSCNVSHLCRANIYVDGVQIAVDGQVSIDQTIPLEWVEAIEVYRRAAEIPAEFLGRATCGVVAVWTRRGDDEATTLDDMRRTTLDDMRRTTLDDMRRTT